MSCAWPFLLTTPSDAFADIRPDIFHRILTTVIGKNKGALVFDTSANEEVWNFPAYAYETEVTFKKDFTSGDGQKRTGAEDEAAADASGAADDAATESE